MVCDRVQIINQGSLVFHGSIDELKQQRIGNKLQVGLKKAPALKDLKSINFISDVEKIEGDLFRFHFKTKVDSEKLACLCVEKKWGLYHIAPDVTSLEDIFAQLTMLGDKS
jgi:ABC-2 type transport system ATP-binding protein